MTYSVYNKSIVKNKEEQKMKKSVKEKLIGFGLKVWEKGETRRIYINDLSEVANKLGYEMVNPKLFKKTSIYYDCVTEKFSFDCQSSVKESVREVIALLRKE